MTFQLVLLVLATFVFYLIFRWRRKTFSYFESIGIPGPSPNLIWGNMPEYHKNGFSNALSKWCETYGDIYGFYNGDIPTLVVKDLDLLEHVFVTNFQNFRDRGETMRTNELHHFLGSAIINAKGEQWKTLRGYTSMAVSPANLRKMIPHMSDQADVLVNVLGEMADLGKEVSTFETFQALAMDSVGRIFLGLNTTFQQSAQHPFITKALDVVPEMMTGPFHFIAHCTTSFGSIMKPLYWLNRIVGTFSVEIFSRDIAKMVENRRNNPSLRMNDVLQILLDAEVRQVDGSNNEKNGLSRAKGKPKRLRELTREEVILQSTFLLLAGFQTISISLSYATFMLAKHPDVQEKVRKEVNESIAISGCLDYDMVMHKLKYLGQVLDETLRMYPPSLTISNRRLSVP